MDNWLIVDTGPIVAYLHGDDNWHRTTKKFLAKCRFNLVTTWAVITEAAYLSKSSIAFLNLMKWIERGSLTVICQDAQDAATIARYQRKYANRDPDFADLSLLALADRERLKSIITVDQDFSIYRLANGKALCNLL